MLARFLARQLACPSGVFGAWILAPLWNRRNVALNDAALAHLELEPSDRVLEVGFGGGYLLGRMAAIIKNGALAGVDASPAMVAGCQRRYRGLLRAGRLDLHCAPAEALPLPAEHVTAVCSVNSAFYWRDVDQALSELWRVLRRGGRLVVCLTCRHSLAHKNFARHGLTLYDADEFGQHLARSGFSDIRLTPGADRHRAFFCAVAQKRGHSTFPKK